MKTNVYFEHAGKQVKEEDLVKAAKSLWTKSGKKVADIKTMRLYVKPEDGAAYIVINDDFKSVVML